MSAMAIWKDWKTWLEIFVLFGTLISLAIPLGRYIAKVYQGQPLWLDKIIGPIERAIYKTAWIDSSAHMPWKDYAKAVIALGLISFLVLFTLLRLQYYLPLNPQNFTGIEPDLAFNIAISFLTNTDWQSYEGEKVLSYFSQMIGLSVQNFVSAATGMAVAIAFVRGIIGSASSTLGNFWVDVTRGILYILLPLSFFMAILLSSQGVIQNFSAYLSAPSIELNAPIQVIPGGPVASQVAIKILGSNGGGFFGANSAHPFENPTPFSNFLQLLGILLIPVSFIIAYGKMICQPKQSRAILGLLFTILIMGFISCSYLELNGALVNFEGKEYRHGILNSVLWTVASTATSNGSTNALIGEFTALGSMIPLLFMLTGEVIFGGVGQGLYSIILFIIITVFIAGLMVGRMPAYLGKKIEVFEIKMTMLAMLIPPLTLLIIFAIAVQIPQMSLFVSAQSARGFTEAFYAFASTSVNNGTSFGEVKANMPFLNTLFGITMVLGRYGVMIPVLAIGGSFIQKSTAIDQGQYGIKSSAISAHSIVFMVLFLSAIFLISLLNFFPAVLMGPIAEYLAGVNLS